ncbi:MAG TPA: PQQ-dependent sugar dehydrogenase [Tepidisphaeraceae bacterium]|jgi:glucose/arabinose dehydrogenase
MIHSRRVLNLGVIGVSAGMGALGARADIPMTALRLQSGLAKPIFVGSPEGDTNRLFVVEQGTGGSARIRVLNLATNTFNPNPFITISGLATGSVGSEQGLLGLAFDPNFATNGYFYVNYTATGGSFGNGITRVVRYTASGNTASTSTAQLVMQFDQPQTNHNAGWLGFGKDGYLYIATGDGGNSNDQGTGHTANIGNAQDLTKLLGKMLRVDVSADDYPSDPNKNYAIPKGGPGQPPKNPFYNDPANPTAAPEIWHYGLRNPWRDSFDRKTGDLYIGDVGQGAREEVDFSPANSAGGTNFGWHFREGKIATPGITATPPAGFNPTDPIFDYDHTNANGGIAVSGGYVYRGSENPALEGTYFFADYGNAKIWMTKYSGTGNATVRLIQNPQASTPLYLPTVSNIGRIDNVSSFGEDALGRLYVVELGTNDTSGELYRLIPPAPGDANLDRIVDITDFSTFYRNYDPAAAGKTWRQGDFNDDQIVDFRDYQILELAFGQTVPFGSLPDGTLVPEPGVLVGLGLTMALLIRRRAHSLSRYSGRGPG